jgi:hypothetical protein
MVTPKERRRADGRGSRGCPGIKSTGVEPTSGKSHCITKSEPEARITSTRGPREEKKLSSKETGWRSPFNRARKDSTNGSNEESRDP